MNARRYVAARRFMQGLAATPDRPLEWGHHELYKPGSAAQRKSGLRHPAALAGLSRGVVLLAPRGRGGGCRGGRAAARYCEIVCALWRGGNSGFGGGGADPRGDPAGHHRTGRDRPSRHLQARHRRPLHHRDGTVQGRKRRCRANPDRPHLQLRDILVRGNGGTLEPFPNIEDPLRLRSAITVG